MGKQEKWQWIREHEPALATMLLEINRYFGKPDKVELNREKVQKSWV